MHVCIVHVGWDSQPVPHPIQSDLLSGLSDLLYQLKDVILSLSPLTVGPH